MSAAEFVCGTRIGGVWRVARANVATGAIVAGVGATPERALSDLYARDRRNAQHAA